MNYLFAPAISEHLTPEQLREWPQRLRNAQTVLLLIYGRLHGVDPDLGKALEAYVNGASLSPSFSARIRQLIK